MTSTRFSAWCRRLIGFRPGVRLQLEVLEGRCLPSMTLITNASTFPFSAAVHIESTFPNRQTYFGSGAMVDGTHVLTAGHMVFDESLGGWATQITLYAGMTGRNSSVAIASGTWERTFTSYVNDNVSAWQRNHDNRHVAGDGDIGMITSSTDISSRTGYFAYGYDDGTNFAGSILNTLGYPAQNYPGVNQYLQAGTISGTIDGTSGSFSSLYFSQSNIHMEHGQSGSPVFAYFTSGPHAGQRIIYGIMDVYNSSTGYAERITSDVFAALQSWRANDNSPTEHTGRGVVRVLDRPHSTTHTTLVASAWNSQPGQAVTFTATVSADNGQGVPTGSVTFLDSGIALATVNLDAYGNASFTTSSLVVGNHSISATYNPTGPFLAGTPAFWNLVVSAINTSTTLTSSANPVTAGQPVTFTATVAAGFPNAGIPTGSITFLDGNIPLMTVPLDTSGSATFTTGSLTAGAHVLTAVYTPSGDFADSTSAVLTETVNAAPVRTSTSLESSANPVTAGQPVTFTATVVAADAAAGPPTGSVNFVEGGNLLLSVPLDVGGRASFTTAALAAGPHVLTAVYIPTGNFTGGTSPVLTETISHPTLPPPSSGFSVGTFDPRTSIFYLRNSASSGAADAGTFQFGLPGWKPLAGNWSGSGPSNPGVFDPTTGVFYLRTTNDPSSRGVVTLSFGLPNWVPLAGDWDGTGATKVGIFDPSTATFYLRGSNNPTDPRVTVVQFGVAGWIPLAGDWNNTGHWSVGIFNPASATFYLRNTPNPADGGVNTFQYGAAGWLPVAGRFDGRNWGVGVVDPGTQTWYIRFTTSAGAPSVPPFVYGAPGWIPLTGNGSGSTSGPLAAEGLTDLAASLIALRKHEGEQASGPESG
jgi:hypothetical protein